MTLKVAHDASDDNQTNPLHCPWCGSGQLLGNSDGTISCQYCQRTFNITAQPNFPGMPMQPEQQDAGMPDTGQQNNPAGQQGLPTGPTDPQQGGPDQGQGETQQIPQPNADDLNEQQPFRTSSGHWLPLPDYLDHLAILFADHDRDAVIARIKARRQSG